MTNTTDTRPAYVETYTVYRQNGDHCTVYAAPDGTLDVRDLEGYRCTPEITPEEIATVAGPTLMYRHAAILTERLGSDAFVVDPWAAWPVEERPNRIQTGH